MYEIRHNLSWWDSLVFGIMSLFGSLLAYGSVSDFSVMAEKCSIDTPIVVGFFGFSLCWVGIYNLFYTRKNKIYITNQGIGFERRNWFKMQKGFFKFFLGGVGGI